MQKAPSESPAPKNAGAARAQTRLRKARDLESRRGSKGLALLSRGGEGSVWSDAMHAPIQKSREFFARSQTRRRFSEAAVRWHTPCFAVGMGRTLRLGRIGAVLLGALSASCADYESEAAAPNHDIEIVATDITLVDGLAFHPTGAILATEEYRGGGIVRVDPVSGSYTRIARDLEAPDNVVVFRGSTYLTEEAALGRILKIDNRQQMTTFASDLDDPEGLDVGPDDKLYVAEHAAGGHVYRYSLDGSRETFGSVEDGEGLRVLPDGSVIVAETSAGRIVRFAPDGTKTTVSEGALTMPDGVRYDPVLDRLLVTEDAAPGRMVQVDLVTGAISVVATGLNAPQTMLIETDGSILVAEQGEDRILRLRPKGPTP
jgi:streptogramin lyase